MATQKRTAILLAFLRRISAIRYQDPDQWEKVKLDHKVSKYFPGGAEAFANPINKDAFFKHDEIVMHPDDFRNKNVLGDLYDEIIGRYLKNGWRLFP
jgi:hypothetical protein